MKTPDCPDCGQATRLVALRDDDQGYWCDACEHGWRIGTWPLTKKGAPHDSERRAAGRPGRRRQDPA